MKPQDLIKFTALSKFLSGGIEGVRRKKIPLVHQPKIDKLMKLIEGWMKENETK